MGADYSVKAKRTMAKDATRVGGQEGSYAIFTGSGVRIDLASFFRSESGRKALKEVADSAKRAGVRSAKTGRLTR